jgi:hypothetical protein
MKPGRRTLLTAIVVLLGVVTLIAAARSGSSVQQWIDSDIMYAGEPFVFNGERETLVVIGRSTITLEGDTDVSGDVALFAFNGDPVVIDGAIEGDLLAWGANVTLAEGGRVDGDAILIGAELALLGRVDGDVVLTGDALTIGEQAGEARSVAVCGLADRGIDNRAGVSFVECPDETADISIPLGWMIGGLGFGMTVLGALGVSIFPRQISQMDEAIRRRTLRVAGTGVAALLLTFGITAALVLALALIPLLGFLLMPLYLLTLMVVGGAAVTGSITLAYIVGDWLMSRLNVKTPPLVSSLVGGALFGLPLTMLGFIPALEGVALLGILALALMGIGAALLTRFGTRRQERQYFVQG